MVETDIKHGSTANNVAMETWLKLDASSTAIDKNSEFFEMTIQRNSTSSTTGFDGIYVCRVDGYKIENTSGDVILVIHETTFDSDDDEVGDNVNVKYCKICKYWERV